MTEDKRTSLKPSFDVDALAEGAQFGPYRIVRMLAAGGMGQVYEAQHVPLAKRVALKVIVPEQATNHEIVERFVREAQATARVRHPNVVDITDVGEVAGVPYLVMEYLEGEPLTNYIYQKGQLGIEESVDLLLPILSALQAAHEKNIVHRDIKPDNIFLVREAGRPIRPMLVDFGISKLLDDGEINKRSLTKTALVIGTPYYIAPEQAQDSRNVDPRADLYSVAVVFYEMISGVVPFTSEQLMSLLLQIAKGEYTPLHLQRADVDPALSLVAAKAMSVHAEGRYANAKELARALLPFASPAVAAMYEKEFGPALPPPMFEVQGEPRDPTSRADTLFGSQPTLSIDARLQSERALPTSKPGRPAEPLGTAPSPMRRSSASTSRPMPSANKERHLRLLAFAAVGAVMVAFVAMGLIVYLVASRQPVATPRAPSRQVTRAPRERAQELEAERVAEPTREAPTRERDETEEITAAPRTAVEEPSAAKLPSRSAPRAAPRSTTTNGATSPSTTYDVTTSSTEAPRSGWGAPSWGTTTPAQTPTEESTRAPTSPHAQASLRFSGACAPSFGGDLRVRGTSGGVRVTSSLDGRVLATLTVAACSATGRYELGTNETARYGVNVTLEQGGRSWSALPNSGATFGDSTSGGAIFVNRTHCGQGIVDVRFDDAELVNASRQSHCTINGTLRTTGSD